MQKNILVIEDEAAIREMIAFALESEGFQVTGVENGHDARQAVSETIPDLMLIDWMLPGVSGLELVRGFRRSATTRTIPIIMLTARSEENDRCGSLADFSHKALLNHYEPDIGVVSSGLDCYA